MADFTLNYTGNEINTNLGLAATAIQPTNLASTTAVGVVKVDGTTITAATDGTISGTKNVQLYYNGTNILDKKGGTVLTYTDIYTLISDTKNVLSVNYADSNVLYPAFWTGDAIAFSNIALIESKSINTRLIINAENQILYEEEELVENADVVNNVTSTTTDKPLSANMGKELQDQITNLKNIGRFLSIWDCATGKPLTDPLVDPYTYKTGDYYRVGTVAAEGGTNYKPNGATYTKGSASTTVETEDVEVGAVYYYDGDSWEQQAAGAGGKVQDVQVNGTTILDLNTGIANIPAGSASALGAVKVDGTTITAADGVISTTAKIKYWD